MGRRDHRLGHRAEFCEPEQPQLLFGNGSASKRHVEVEALDVVSAVDGRLHRCRGGPHDAPLSGQQGAGPEAHVEQIGTGRHRCTADTADGAVRLDQVGGPSGSSRMRELELQQPVQRLLGAHGVLKVGIRGPHAVEHAAGTPQETRHRGESCSVQSELVRHISEKEGTRERRLQYWQLTRARTLPGWQILRLDRVDPGATSHLLHHRQQ